MDEVRMLLQEMLDEGLYQITVSKALHPGEDGIFKKKVRPVMMKGDSFISDYQLRGKTGFFMKICPPGRQGISWRRI